MLIKNQLLLQYPDFLSTKAGAKILKNINNQNSFLNFRIHIANFAKYYEFDEKIY